MVYNFGLFKCNKVLNLHAFSPFSQRVTTLVTSYLLPWSLSLKVYFERKAFTCSCGSKFFTLREDSG